ncbi:hypothetical protein HZH68_002502 [Vespula germanica]|uniref:Uncharacterized protein n=1 Tax=Vespula germanica TaxID=30212 RepID=A0A834U196_VESGE|nr:hypothetical protein HZH68_002502 [Vespula germanica]
MKIGLSLSGKLDDHILVEGVARIKGDIDDRGANSTSSFGDHARILLPGIARFPISMHSRATYRTILLVSPPGPPDYYVEIIEDFERVTCKASEVKLLLNGFTTTKTKGVIISLPSEVRIPFTIFREKQTLFYIDEVYSKLYNESSK